MTSRHWAFVTARPQRLVQRTREKVTMKPQSVEVRNVRVEKGVWTAVVTLAGHAVSVISDLEPEYGDEAAARAMFEHTAQVAAARYDAVVAAATEELMPLYNDVWRTPDAATLSAAAFAERLVPDSVRTTDPSNPARLITLYFRCDGLFAGHFVECALEWDGSPLGPPQLIG